MKDTKKLTWNEFVEREKGNTNFPLYSQQAIKLITEAYSDGNGVASVRSLSFFSPMGFRGQEAHWIADKCIGSYNKFNADRITQIQEIFGQDTLIFFAREGSVCLYIQPSEPFSLTSKPSIDLKLEADEFQWVTGVKMFRIWWD